MDRRLFPLSFALLTACSSSSNEAQPDAGDDAYIPPVEVGGETDPEASVDSSTDSSTATIPVRSCKTVFEVPSTTPLEIAGEWDGFVAHTPMTATGSGTYRVEMDLPKGDYGYKIIYGGTDWRLDPTHGRRKYVGGIENSRVKVPDCKLPLLQVKSFEAKADGTVNIDVQYVDGSQQHGPASTIKVPSGTFDFKTGVMSIRAKGLPKGKTTFVLDAEDSESLAAETLYIPTWIEDEPFQWTDGPMYFAFTDRFRNGDTGNDAPIAGIDPRANYQGGDWAGVLASLKDGYFDKLGVRSIWLSPVNDNTDQKGKGSDGRDYSGYHGYWPIEPRKTEPHFGSIDDLKALTAEAHKRGIRVVLDLVQNQVHQQHAYVTTHSSDGWFNGDGSCTCGGPMCSWDDHPVDCWFTSYLPDVNWTNTGAQDAFVEDALWWLREGDVDGFRVDAVKHMNDVASTALRTEIKARYETGNARYYLVGETFTGGDDGGRALIQHYVGPNALWGQFDFPLFWSIDYAFAQMGGTMGDLDAAVQKSDTSYGPGAVMSPFLGNHDVTRFLSRAAGQIDSNPQEQAWNSPPAAPSADEPYDRAYLAFAFLLAQPGVPLIYYGDEVGTPGTADPDNRRFLKTEASLSTREKKLLDRVRAIAKLRGTLPGLRRGARRTLKTDGDGYVLARGTGADVVIVSINRGTTNRTVDADNPSELGLADGTVLKDLLGGPSITVTAGKLPIPFTAKGVQVFVR
jgi:glycosidase